jgi:arylsulfatase A-like enzyme
MKKWFLMREIGLGSAALSLAPALAIAEPAPKPNILFLFADDQCHEALGAFGSEVRTPHLDRLARGGVTFVNAYNQGAWHGAVCVASRTMLLTGRQLWNARCVEATLGEEAKARRLWPQYLEKAGYDTYMSGKWHISTSVTDIFGTVAHKRPGMPNQTKAGYNRPTSTEDYATGWKPWDKENRGYWKGGKHWSEVLADDGIGFLQQAAGKDTPFFMYLAFNAPHDPRQSPKEYVDRYPLDSIKIPKNYLPEYPYKDDIGCSSGLRDERLAPFPRTEYAVKVNRQEYYAIITHMDDQIGRILDALEASGKKDSTYIFFTADHGLAVGHHGLIGKQNMFEHSVKPPLILYGPGLPAGKRIEAPVYLQDIMPTTLELAGVPKPAHVQFKSLLPLIRGETQKNYDAIYGAYKTDLQRMVRKGDYKLIYYPKIKKTLLFNLENDPDEMHDLAADPNYAPKIKELFQTLKILQKDTGDTLEITE